VRLGCFALVAALWSSAYADTGLADARRAIDKLDYQKAQSALGDALASGAYGHDELAEIYRLRGIVASTLGDKAAAIAAFERLLALDPNATLPAGTSPKITRPFAEAGRHPLQVTTETATSPPSVTVVIVSDSLGMVSGARAIVVADGKAEETRTAQGSGRMTLAMPAGKRLEVRVAVLDEHGNRLAELGSASAPIVIERVETVVAPPPKPVVVVAPPPLEHHSIVTRWWLWGTATVVFAAGGTIFGLAARSAGHDLEALNADSKNHTFGEAQSTLSRGQRDALISNLGFGVAAATAIVAGIMFARGGDEHPLPIVPVVAHGGGGVSLEVPF
jgi:hypothetical protein